jgi:hypothetical protein
MLSSPARLCAARKSPVKSGAFLSWGGHFILSDMGGPIEFSKISFKKIKRQDQMF